MGTTGAASHLLSQGSPRTITPVASSVAPRKWTTGASYCPDDHTLCVPRYTTPVFPACGCTAHRNGASSIDASYTTHCRRMVQVEGGGKEIVHPAKPYVRPQEGRRVLILRLSPRSLAMHAHLRAQNEKR